MGFEEKGEKPRGTKPNNPWINGSFDLISRRTVSEVSDGSMKLEETRIGKATDLVPLSMVCDGIGCIASRLAKACEIAPKYDWPSGMLTTTTNDATTTRSIINNEDFSNM